MREEVECYYSSNEDTDVKTNKENIVVLVQEAGRNQPVSPNIEKQTTASREGIQRIHFYNRVAVHRIPGRDLYTDDVRRSLWHNSKELTKLANRNTIEFAADGYDWRRAAEEEDMYKLPTGELIHPVWEQYWHFRPIQEEPLRNCSSGVAA